MRCKVWRVTPSCFARVETGILNAGMVTSLSKAPGWLGARSGCRSVLRAMIVLQVDIDGIFVVPAERQPPISRYRDGEAPRVVALQSMEAADILQLLGRTGPIERRQQRRHLV